jgi:quercetin dioxygenase-like cupin family protein
MRTTIFTVEGERVVPRVVERPRWQPLEEYDGKPLERVRADDLIALPDVLMQLVEIGARGQFAMHSSPDIAFCQIIRGKGRVGLPDGGEIAYTSPELYVFLPGTLHDWHSVDEDTLLSVCLCRRRAGS